MRERSSTGFGESPPRPRRAGCSTMSPSSGGLVVTHDTIAEGVHFLSSDPLQASAGSWSPSIYRTWPRREQRLPAALLSLTMCGSGQMGARVSRRHRGGVRKLRSAVDRRGHDRLPAGAPRVLGLTAIGHAGKAVPDRAGGKTGGFVCGWSARLATRAAGLALLREDRNATGPLVEIYRRPVPQLGAGRGLAPHAHAMMDVSDGLLLDAKRMAQASGCRIRIHLDALPLSARSSRAQGPDLDARLFAATGGDDYALLAALPPDVDPSTLSLPEGTTIERIGTHRSGRRVGAPDQRRRAGDAAGETGF